jgi:uncharacterized membrane protein
MNPSSIQSFSINGAFSQAWHVFTKKWAFVYLIGIVTLLASFLPAIFLGGLMERTESGGITIIFQVVNFLWSSAVAMGNMYVLIRIIREQPTELADMLKPLKYLGQYAWATFLYSLLMIVGMLLFIIPGLYWGYKYMYVPYLIVDKGMRTSDAFKMSALMTKGVKLKLFVFGIVTALVNIAGFLAIGFGLLITIPITALAYIAIYPVLLAQVPDSDAVEGEVVR